MKIESFYTPCPLRVAGTSSIKSALEQMAENGIRHLPVQENNMLVGVLSAHDAEFSLSLCATTGYCPDVGAICAKNPYIVSLGTELVEVLRHMAEKKIECALVSDSSDQLVGVFTNTDAIKLAQRLLEDRGAE